MRKRKVTNKKAPHPVFLVVCEGETEREYIEALKRHYRLPITIKTKVSGSKINQRLVSQYLSELGLEKGDKYQVFFVYDADVNHIVDKLSKLDGTLILSNPCIELWFILHVKEYRRAAVSSGIVKELANSHSMWGGYMKGQFSYDQTNFLILHKDRAMVNAKKLLWPENPSSNMYSFIEAMENAKNG